MAPDFDPSANRDHGHCTPRFEGCAHSSFANYEPGYNTHLQATCSLGGCMDSAHPSYEALATFDDASCPTSSATRRQLQTSDCSSSNNCCIDPNAINYNSDASTHQPSSCKYRVVGCTDSLASNYFSAATHETPADSLDAASPCAYPVYGCTIEAETLNYDSDAEVLTDCVFALPACTDSGNRE